MKLCTVGEALWALAVLGGAIGLACALLELALALLAAHDLNQRRIDSEAWMLSNCLDPVFSSQLRAHTNVCSQVEASARIGAWGAALRDVSATGRVSFAGHTGALMALPVLPILCAGVGLLLACLAREWGRDGPEAPSFVCKEA
jgi:hypothetical protein